MPREAMCGLCLKEFIAWNQAAMLKKLWSIKRKKYQLWLKWVHTYYIQGRPLLQCHVPMDICWLLKKIVSMMGVVVQ